MTLCPIHEIGGPVIAIRLPAIENTDIDRFVNRRSCCRVLYDRADTNCPIVRPEQFARSINAPQHLAERVMNTGFILISVNDGRPLEYQPVQYGLLHEPDQGNLCQQSVGITAADIRMCSDEPTLLNFFE